MILWFVFAFLAAFLNSLKGVFGKKSVKIIDEYIVAWSLRFFTVLFLLPLLFLVDSFEIGNAFWWALLSSGILNTVATVFFVKALKLSDLSIISPIASFTPLFLLITSPVILGEFPNLVGFVGVVLIFSGSYFLRIQEIKNGLWAPLVKLFKERGVLFMLLTSFIWSISSNIDKIGVQNSSPIIWTISINLFITIVLFPFIVGSVKNGIVDFKKGLRYLIPIGLFSSLALVFQMTAIELTLVVYVIAIKGISSVFGVIWGCKIFKEERGIQKLVSSLIIFLGVLFIIFS